MEKDAVRAREMAALLDGAVDMAEGVNRSITHISNSTVRRAATLLRGVEGTETSLGGEVDRHADYLESSAMALETAAGLLDIERESRARRGNAPGRGWADAACYLTDGAKEMRENAAANRELADLRPTPSESPTRIEQADAAWENAACYMQPSTLKKLREAVRAEIAAASSISGGGVE